MLESMSEKPAWRVAVTHDDIDRSVHAALERAGFIAVSCPVMIETAAPDQPRLDAAARDLHRFDMVICSSVRSVRALIAARGSKWPRGPRAAAVGSGTAAALVEAGAADPIVADTFTAKALWEKLQALGSWRGVDVLVTTVEGGRRDLIDGLIGAGARVTELEAYRMVPRHATDIRIDWTTGRPDVLMLGSAATAHVLVDAIGLDAIRALRVVVPIGPTTAAALAEHGITAEPPGQATFPAVISKLVTLRARAGIDKAQK
jgi:uroporphyrinogen-III synthase